MASSRFFAPAVTTAVLGLALVVACSGASKQDVLQGSASGSSSGTSGTSGTTGASGASGTSGASGASGASGTSGTSGTSGASGAPSCPQEKEPNDTEAQANALAPTLCGAIQPVGDVDWLTFTLKPSTTKMQVKFDGKVTLTITVDGQTVTLGAGGNQIVPFVQGKPYFVEVRPLDARGTPAWRVDLVEQ